MAAHTYSLRPSGIVTLLTDFGHKDPFVGVMKGVILTRNPSARIVDLTHSIPPQDLMAGAFWLAESFLHFPKGTVHVGVVDPGVGTARRPLIGHVGGHWFVLPDNGLVSLAARRLNGFEAWDAQALIETPYRSTFDGRDVFAPLAAELSAGRGPRLLKARVTNWVQLAWPQARREVGLLTGEVLLDDHFGNLLTNVRLDPYDRVLSVRCGEHTLPWGSHYASVPRGELVALLNSWGYVELACREGSARERLQVSRGAGVEVHLDAQDHA